MIYIIIDSDLNAHRNLSYSDLPLGLNSWPGLSGDRLIAQWLWTPLERYGLRISIKLSRTKYLTYSTFDWWTWAKNYADDSLENTKRELSYNITTKRTIPGPQPSMRWQKNVEMAGILICGSKRHCTNFSSYQKSKGGDSALRCCHFVFLALAKAEMLNQFGQSWWYLPAWLSIKPFSKGPIHGTLYGRLARRGGFGSECQREGIIVGVFFFAIFHRRDQHEISNGFHGSEETFTYGSFQAM